VRANLGEAAEGSLAVAHEDALARGAARQHRVTGHNKGIKALHEGRAARARAVAS
jgi:hypothetical protein